MRYSPVFKVIGLFLLVLLYHGSGIKGTMMDYGILEKPKDIAKLLILLIRIAPFPPQKLNGV